MCVKTMGQKVYTCAHVRSARLLNSLLTSHMLCVEFFSMKYTVFAYITIHILTSDTEI